MKTPRTARAAWAAAALTFGLSTAVGAQTPGMTTTATGVTSPGFHHVHEGPLGEQWLEVEEAIRCTCGGCSEDVHHCQFRMECGTSPGYSERILLSLQAGQTPKEIKASFVADFGESILTEPPMKGFNLVGWFLPGITILMAGALVGLLARGGVGQPKAEPLTRIDPEDEERLREAMRKLDEAESPDW